MNRPVVIIPGFYGSKLSDADGDLVWLDGHGIFNPRETMAALKLSPQTWDRLHPSGILDEIPVLPFISPDIYKRLTGFLRHNLRYPDELVRCFYYDWRKSMAEAAGVLDRQIERWLHETGATQVDLVAHSQGGLVARAYLKHFGARAQGRVHRLITLGTPHTGMLKTMQALTEGIGLGFFSRAQTRDTSRTFPAAFELLPQGSANGLFQWNGAAADPLAVSAWCQTPAMRQLLADAAGTLSTHLDGSIPVPACFIYGTRLDTLTAASGTAAEGVRYTRSDDGDSTVPLVSARGDGLTGGQLQRYPIPFGSHMLLFDDEAVQNLLTDMLLRDQTPAFHLAVRWEQGRFYRPRSRNRLVIAFTDGSGQPVPGGAITLRFSTPRWREVRVSPLTHPEVEFTKTMPGGGSVVRCTVTATAPTLLLPMKRTLLIKSVA